MSITQSAVRQSSWPCVAHVAILGEDCKRWLATLMAEIERVDFGVAWYADRVSSEDIEKIDAFPRTVGWTWEQNQHREFDESYRNYPVEMAVKSGAEWTARWDCDETFEPNAPALIKELLDHKCQWKVHWYQVWQEALPFPLIRFDPPFELNRMYRWVFHPLRTGADWYYGGNPIGSMSNRGADIKQRDSDLRVLHWGFAEREDRLMHRDRWNRIYKNNPYGTWNAVCDETKAPWLYPFLPWMTHQEYCEHLAIVGNRVDDKTKELWLPEWAKKKE